MNVLVFPHQLFRNHPLLQEDVQQVILIEDSLFFGDGKYPAQFHKQKLWLHRATMRRFQRELDSQGVRTKYLEYQGPNQNLGELLGGCLDRRRKHHQCACLEPADFILEKRLGNAGVDLKAMIAFHPTPGFINTRTQNEQYRATKNRWFMADFYKWQRKRLNVLMEADGPEGGQWSYDQDNRKKVPKKKLTEIPTLEWPSRDEIDEEARSYVNGNFPKNPGSVDQLFYPTSWQDADAWLEHFLRDRFAEFGDFEDAIVENESWLWHSVLTPSLNIGLLTPEQVASRVLEYAREHDTPLNSVEGFIRQVIGWREFMRATYEDLGVTMRNSNHWQHTREMPSQFYDGTTGIDPIDDTIQRILETGYCHHIERLMVLGGFMFLCEIDPQHIYRWFMEMFVDSYDWVMVPNVYAMSQHADGGLITTKPYFSGSSYVRKMSHYSKGPWCDVWDGLYWCWIENHVDELEKNPRWSMMCSMCRKMDAEKRQKHSEIAERFLAQLV